MKLATDASWPENVAAPKQFGKTSLCAALYTGLSNPLSLVAGCQRIFSNAALSGVKLNVYIDGPLWVVPLQTLSHSAIALCLIIDLADWISSIPPLLCKSVVCTLMHNRRKPKTQYHICYV